MPFDKWPQEHQELVGWLNAQLATASTSSSWMSLSAALLTPSPSMVLPTDDGARVKSLHHDLRTGEVLIDLVEVRPQIMPGHPGRTQGQDRDQR